MKRKLFWMILLMGVLLLTACGGAAPTEAPPPEAPPPPLPSEEAQAPEPEPEPEEPTAVPEPDFDPLPPDPQRIEFQAADETNLVGYYYPASIPDAPLVVLMHWAGGDQTDWTNVGMVQWLQNRGGGSGGMQAPSSQASIYPMMPEGVSFAVFTFDFRGFGESEGSFEPQGGFMDAQAAYEIAQTLSGIDPQRMAGIGSSIGADGVIDLCGSGCLGTFSLSPGSYLKIPYDEAVNAVDLESKPAWCIASEGDSTSASTCRSASGDHYKMVIYPGSAHGTQLLMEPNVPDDIGQLILDWLVLAFSIQS